MRALSAHRVKHRKWLELPLLAGVFVAAVITVAIQDAQGGTLGWAGLVFPAYVVAYLAVGPVVMKALGARDEWHISLVNDTEISLKIVYFDAFLPIFQEYVVFVDGQEHARFNGSWKASDTLDFHVGEDPSHAVSVVVGGIDIWPIMSRRLTLAVDEEELVNI